MRQKARIFAAFAIVVLTSAILFPGCAKKEEAGKEEQKGRVTVGAKNFTEQYIVGNMMAELLRNKGFEVKEQFGTGSKITRDGLETGQTDLYAEYTGTAWSVYLGHDTTITDPETLFAKVKEEDLADHNIVWLDRWELNNTYALAMKQDEAKELDIASIGNLASYVSKQPEALNFGIDQEFYERPDGFFKMAETYDFTVAKKQVKTMDVGLSYEALDRGQVDVAMVFATDGLLKKYGLRVLSDDKNFFPVYNLAVTVRKEVIDKHPEIADIMKPLAQLLDDTTMQGLNYRVDAEGLPAKMVAQEFLKDNGLIE
ncbi:glycine betaine ABC transporter substrate-binding protein [Sediminispirochaeta smaragdinae]|jgi:osmoprotectant transport system substrate-binding protein|uniref:Substrate-binding region of ABC-type glycine betaine transport system n=1 Tax=Sediminispirochaeta smaragdinae (strain DSM 11293 / JCM 15392 / SEBR 4228) TaxID=573413 RepID=E1RCQ7_SEDSS|nr:glycine betaine ABC transporter substrate-binding protein [Sediminispirochaeta smaragdinae]ADK80137.1 Substrate-binding region of ABC-type glycine betaine transport system [Sediminispirochaeta smaragdinae DSM 11293]